MMSNVTGPPPRSCSGWSSRARRAASSSSPALPSARAHRLQLDPAQFERIFQRQDVVHGPLVTGLPAQHFVHHQRMLMRSGIGGYRSRACDTLRARGGDMTMTGLAFVGCDLVSAAPAQAQARRREVVVSGRRVKTVDVHAHCAVPEAMALMGLKLGTPGSNSPPVLQMATQVSERLRAMDAQGIDVEALSINPYWYKAERDLATELIALQTEQLGVLVFMHPQGTGAPAELAHRFKGNGLLWNVIGNPLETTIALSHLIFEGTLDRFPGLKICAAHGGGYLPSYAGRSDQGCHVFPDRCPGPKDGPLKKKPTEYLTQLYYDNIMFTPEAMRHLVAEVGSGQIVLGTDFPYPWTTTSVELVLGTPGLDDAERVAMLGETAAKLLGIK